MPQNATFNRRSFIGMQKQIFTLFLFLLASIWAEAQFAGSGFLENGGQWPEEVFAAAPSGKNECFLTNTGWTYRLYQTTDFEDYHEFAHHREGEQPLLHGHIIQVELLGASFSKAKAISPKNAKTNILKAEIQASNLLTFEKYHFYDVYSGVDLLWEDFNGQLKYSFIVSPNTSTESIALLWKGHDQIEITDEGHLKVTTSVGDLIEWKPEVYQFRNGVKEGILAHFQINEDTIRFEIGDYDRSRELIIDPNVIFSSYSGASSDNWGFTATYDNSGRLYLGGIGFGFGFPTSPGAFDTIFLGGTDVTLMRFSSDGVNREYATFLGGSNAEQPHSLIVSGDELIIMGVTGSSDFPVSSTAYDTSFAGGSPITGTGATFNLGTDIFITRLSADGSQAIGSTFLGGSESDGINAELRNNYGDRSRGEVNLDSQGNILVASCTLSNDFPNTTGVSSGGNQDGVATKLSSDLTQVFWSTYLGGIDQDAAFSVAEINGLTYFTGATSSNTFPSTPGTYRTSYYGGNSDGFLTALDPSNGNLSYSTFIGSFARDLSFFVHSDQFGNPAILGQTTGNIPMPANKVFGDTNSRQFIQLFSPQLDELLRSTRVGSGRPSYDFAPSAFLVDSCGITYISGWGGSLNSSGSRTNGLYVTADAFQSTTDGNDFYLLALDANWDQALYGTFFGGPSTSEHVDGGTSRFSPDGIISQAVCAGCGGTNGTPAFPSNAWSTVNGSGNCNMLGFKIEFDLDTMSIDLRLRTDTVCVGDSARFLLSVTNGDSLFWDYGDGRTASGFNEFTTFPAPGDYTVSATAFNRSCLLQERDSVNIHVRDPSGNAQLIVQFDPCDTLREVAFDISGTSDFFLIYSGFGTVVDSVPSSIFYPDSGIYKPFLLYFSGGCFIDQFDTVEVNFQTVPPPISISTDHLACQFPLELELEISASDHSWFEVDYGDGSIDSGWTSMWSHIYDSPGVYQLRVSATDSLCGITRSKLEEVQIGQEDIDRLAFPNVFTPNGDNQNDVLLFDEALRGWDVLESSLRVYNRWGTELYSGPAIWDGICESGDCAEGVYYWILNWKNSCGDEKVHQGFVHLMR